MVMKKIPLTQGKFAIVDDDLYDWASQFSWYLHSEGYAVREEWNGGNKKRFRMHREINKTPKGMDTDHINGNRLDNRRDNLRTCTRSKNLQNARVRDSNRTGYKGVAIHKASGLYHAYINVDGKQISLKYHKTPEDAARAYNRAAIKYFGEFARLNEV